ncbi:hypothetical protein POG22_13375, partial [Geitlerinema sp. CS-897]|nr:hypothetical protein [Geitlerinema sp. CS-897]
MLRFENIWPAKDANADGKQISHASGHFNLKRPDFLWLEPCLGSSRSSIVRDSGTNCHGRNSSQSAEPDSRQKRVRSDLTKCHLFEPLRSRSQR